MWRETRCDSHPMGDTRCLLVWSVRAGLCATQFPAMLSGLQREDCESEEFLRIFSGSPPASYDCWATAYGASFTGSYGGQRGDGRAISIGQCGGFEIQLKGAGITPYSRQFDGRAVLRSSVREVRAHLRRRRSGPAAREDKRSLCGCSFIKEAQGSSPCFSKLSACIFADAPQVMSACVRRVCASGVLTASFGSPTHSSG